MRNRILFFTACFAFLLSLCACNPTAPPPTETVFPSTQATIPTVTKPTQTETAPTQTVPTVTQPTQPENTVDPDSFWVPICQEYINLRATPDGALLTTIGVGETMTLNGWTGKYALVTYGDTQGYVLSNYIKPADETYFAKHLRVVTPTQQYSYQQMLEDMSALQLLYPDQVRLASIGTSELGRRIPVMQIGNPTASHHVLLQGAIHAREHFTACLLMALADYTLSQGAVSDICYHIIPMSNPDGVILSQSGTLDATQTQIYQNDLAAGYTSANAATYAQQWKANALGIDLNRNFSSGWDVSLEHPAPSSEKYRGSEAFSAAESRALRDYTLQHTFDATISVHSHGSVIYYQYGNRQPVNNLSYSMALAVQKTTGYTPLSSDGTTGAGYKDWAMDALGIPSLTLEIGCYNTPLEQRDIYNTFARCKELLPTIEAWLNINSQK